MSDDPPELPSPSKEEELEEIVEEQEEVIEEQEEIVEQVVELITEGGDDDDASATPSNDPDQGTR